MKNTSGIQPTEYKVLIDPTPVETKIGSIILPETTVDSEKYAQIKGRVVAVSPLAFTYASGDEWKAAKASPPKPGDIVLHAKYAGVRTKGKDGREYLIINDKDITALIED